MQKLISLLGDIKLTDTADPWIMWLQDQNFYHEARNKIIGWHKYYLHVFLCSNDYILAKA